ncbi:MAG: class I SAM-dependent methyltransferase [Thermoanaerobaculia bacterium]
MTSLRRFTGAIQRALADLLVPHEASGGYDRFERLYARRPDPWGGAVLERARRKYEWLGGVLRAHAPYESILDVGCGEGLFSRQLRALSPRVVGVDVSLTAVRRARQLVPDATFVNASLEELELSKAFDLVTAVEMLYYVRSPEEALEKLKGLGRNVFLSYTDRDCERLDSMVDRHLRGHQRTVDRLAGGGGDVVAILYRPDGSPG